jgi:hypothetical protein
MVSVQREVRPRLAGGVKGSFSGIGETIFEGREDVIMWFRAMDVYPTV